MINYYDVWFSRINISNQNKMKLLSKYGTSQNLWNIDKKSLYDNEIKEMIINKIFDKKYKTDLDKYIKYMEDNNIDLLNFNDVNYPVSLKNIDNKPVFLYVRGNKENLNNTNFAIVGTRTASEYGKKISREIARKLADNNINVVSGLAIGIDKYAHLGALDSNIGKTIAVLGTGVSNSEVYPLENKKVFERILESGGSIISEFCLGTKPTKYNFPLRNRIISGLADKIIVVEAKKNSGSFITVDYALEQGKDVFAVPRKYYFKNIRGNKLFNF